jgi:phospholipase C
MRTSAPPARAAVLSFVALLSFLPGCQCGGTAPADGGEDGGAAQDGGGPDGGSGDAGGSPDGGSNSDAGADSGTGLQKIQHVIIIMQENRSFDHYFGTFPGVDGLLMADGGLSTECVPSIGSRTLKDGGIDYFCALPDGGVDPACTVEPDGGYCVKLFHDASDINGGGPHNLAAYLADVRDGGMNGYVLEAQGGTRGCLNPNDPACSKGSTFDPMGYHDGRDIPNYWAYAQGFVLQDHMFEPNKSWSNPEHLYLVSEWAADCADAGDPMSCVNSVDTGSVTDHAWTDLTYLLHRAGVSWKYYLSSGLVPDCADGEMDCPPELMDAGVPSIWNPLMGFTTVADDGERGNIVDVDQFYVDLGHQTLPAVSWIIPEGNVSEHPTARVSVGQSYVTGLINGVMQSPYWNSTAIFLCWDDWGGFYDHVQPPLIDENGYGLRTPAMVISPYALRGHLDHQILSHDAYAKFIEDVFLSGQRLDPVSDGRPDPRPSVRESLLVGDLMNDFDFNQTPLPPMVLDQCPYDGGCPCPLNGGACTRNTFN